MNMKLKTTLVNSFLVISFLLLAGCSSFFLGDENLSSAVDLPDNSKVITFNKVWQKKIGNGTNKKSLSLRSVVVSDRVFVVSSGGKLKSFNLDDGKLIWEKNIGHNIVSGVSADEKLVVVGDNNGLLMAFSAVDGSEGWVYQMSTEALSPVNIIEGLVIARAINGQVIALDARTGILVWKQYIGVADLSVRGNARGILLDRVVLFVNSQGQLTLLSIADGSFVFSLSLIMGKGLTAVSQIVDLIATPVVRDDVLFVSAYRQKTLAIDLLDGNLLWESPYATTKDLFVDDNHLYLIDKNSLVHAVGVKDGLLKWAKKTLEGRNISPIYGNNLWLSTIDQEGFLSLLDSQNGNYLGRTKVGGGRSFVAPIMTTRGLLTYTTDGVLTLIDVKGD